MAELLIELFSEEIPARMQRPAAEDLRRLVTDALKAANLEHGETRCFWTPRRLTLVIDGLPEKQPDLKEEKKGPKVGAPDKAVEGFLKSAGLDSLDQCEQRETPKGPVWFAVIEKTGGATADVLPGIVRSAIRGVYWPKSMRWGEGQFRWVRPLHQVLAVFHGEKLEIPTINRRNLSEIERLDAWERLDDGVSESEKIQIVAESIGHRFLGEGSFKVSGFDDYAAKLRDAYVLLDPEERKQSIQDQIRTAADREGLTVKEDPALLDEVTNLVEWPVVLVGRIDDDFMDVPDEALTASMRGHQKYFSLLRPDGTLAPRFAVVANMETADEGARIRAGNERVLRARLADAKFFWDQDLSTKLEDRLPKLGKVIFHAKLGTVAERVERIASLAEVIAGHVEKCPANEARRAARLSKADLVSEMVGEFPELQGIMGRYYALAQNEPESVARAIAEHYSPAGPNDACPSAPVSTALALAEKIDTLVGFWLIDEKPTGSKDPFALRRAALGIIRIVLENGVRLPLTHLIAEAAALYAEQPHVEGDVRDLSELSADLLGFFADRMKAHYRSQGLRHDVVSAVFALKAEDDLLRLSARVAALTRFVESEDGANLLTAYRRAANILKAEEKKDDISYGARAVDRDALKLGAEKSLAHALEETGRLVARAIEGEDFEAAMRALAALRRPVDGFFDDVTVNAEQADLRANRLALLARIRTVMGNVADFSAIEG
ncbi:glycine--tRNA ligase subunit beta [Marivibrio halodurans]|uniref:glycine--tRNA ligase subunit beta n=1 Tax=Marivibrio halodurans TaxID=2039722 RepID=UPI0031BA9A79